MESHVGPKVVQLASGMPWAFPQSPPQGMSSTVVAFVSDTPQMLMPQEDKDVQEAIAASLAHVKAEPPGTPPQTSSSNVVIDLLSPASSLPPAEAGLTLTQELSELIDEGISEEALKSTESD